MVVDYKSRKNEVLASYETVEKLIAEIQTYAAKIELPDPTERLGALLADIRGKAEKVRADRFSIMVAGESKSGKSTFINAYLGVELLPMDVKQCTSAICEIKYGEDFSVKVTYADGRVKTIIGDNEARDFLKENAALDDEYRAIPIPTINSEIIVKSGLRAREKGVDISISNVEVEAMLKSPEVKGANIYNLSDYNQRIKSYIEAKKSSWQDIVTKIEIMFPFPEGLRGIEIIDSPGVCARGGVAEITSQYIKGADAIIFLKPVIGQTLESTQFSQFIENESVERNKNALFLVLTHIATKNEEDLRRLEEEAQKQFSSKLDKRNILFVDSKAELYSKKFAGIDDIESELRRLNKEGILESFVTKAYAETNGFLGEGDTSDFIKKIHEISRFSQIDQSLETFGRKAHYILLSDLLDSIYKLYDKLWNDMNTRIDMLQEKAEDPKELATKIEKVKLELDVIQNKMNFGVERVARSFLGDEGRIKMEVEAEAADFLESVGKIAPDASTAFSDLERLSLQKFDQFYALLDKLQHQVIEEFDRELGALSGKGSIPFESLRPDFTDETFRKIFEETKNSTRSKAFVQESYEEGITFKKTHTRSVYSQNAHFGAIKGNILGRLDDLKAESIKILQHVLENVRGKYISELSNNANAKKIEMDAIKNAKNTAEQIQEAIVELTKQAGKIRTAQSEAKKIKGGILKYVQHNN